MHPLRFRLMIPVAAAWMAACQPARPAPLPAPEATAAAPAEHTRAAAAADTPYTANLAPGSPLTPRQRRWVDSTLATLSLRERVGQMVHVWVLGDYTHVRDPSFAQVRRWIVEDGVGGVTMSLGSPIEVAAKINAMQRLARVPLLVAADLEPGLGRLKGGVFLPYMMTGGSATIVPSNMALGATGEERDAYEAGRIIGREARAVGIQIAFAPTVDVNNNPSNPVINTRSFGEDPAAVAALSAAFVRGLQEEGTVATPKHFPGHGDTDTDSHNALPVVSSDWARLDSVELVPFRAAIDAGAATVMTAHIALPAVAGDSTPATLAPGIISGLLRDTLGFRGVTVTDALTMEGIGQGYGVERSAVLAVQAGADILLKPGSIPRAIDAVMEAVQRGEIPAERIEASARRLLELKARTGVAFQPFVDLDDVREVVGAPEHWQTVARIAERAITLLRDRDDLVPVRSGQRLAVVTYAADTDLDAGRVFAATLRAAVPSTRVIRIGPATGRAELDSLAVSLRRMDRVVVTTHVRRYEGEGRSAVAPAVARWIDTMAGRTPVIVVANGNPYVIRQFPRVGTYMATYGIDPSLERAAARALLGLIPITGRTPVSLPGFFALGDGLRRPVSAAQSRP